VSVALAVIEDIIDASGIAPAIESLLPDGARDRQLSVRTLLAGMMLAIADGRPAHLTRVHAALLALPEADQERLGVTVRWPCGPHQLTYRQLEHTFRLITTAVGKKEPDGAAARVLQQACDALLEASIPAAFKNASSSLAVDWTDIESWSRPPSHGGTACADPEAHWGHRNSNLPGSKGDRFFGYYLSAAVMVKDEHRPAVPELIRRMTVCSCSCDPAAALVPVLQAMAAAGITLGDILADSGYSYRVPGTWAVPVRGTGAQLVVDLHPADRGPRGTHQGAVICNGNLYCPKTPPALLKLGPLPPGAPPADVAAHDTQAGELARHKLGMHARQDADGYLRVACPAVMGKVRCPLRPQSMTLSRDRPEILTPPEHPPASCTQQTITVGPDVVAKTRQKHDYPSPAWRLSYNRRTAAERLNSTVKDAATASIARGWIRLTGLAPVMLWTACLLAARNQRILTAWNKRQQDGARRAERGLPPRQRRKRRPSAASLTVAAASP
jgi:hypothetical protein